VRIEERSRARITKSDLRHLSTLALAELRHFFTDNPDLRKRYSRSLIAVALCQGAALHLINGTAGIKDFDVYFFFGRYDKRLVNRRPKSVDSRLIKFGVHPDDYRNGYKARRVDFLRRSIDNDIVKHENKAPKACIIKYLRRRRTKTARELAKKAVIGLWPETIFSEIIWPTNH
jgi:hypothetical protein